MAEIADERSFLTRAPRAAPPRLILFVTLGMERRKNLPRSLLFSPSAVPDDNKGEPLKQYRWIGGIFLQIGKDVCDRKKNIKKSFASNSNQRESEVFNTFKSRNAIGSSRPSRLSLEVLKITIISEEHVIRVLKNNIILDQPTEPELGSVYLSDHYATVGSIYFCSGRVGQMRASYFSRHCFKLK
ncbi:hypothetical protein PoB_004064600 [Plakobranchus ocellatus]|uniref:Uncharacterized protein n=1 Tax=Plakobranchus ocellatus TaxID=259542 RepID=A0AAV4ASP3_9GAST|nr:hypothetical protein PoB_004064600 [Plakobranchus ocellatus]